MRNWEKNKKDLRRTEERDTRQTAHDLKKKKLKPVEKIKYRLKGYDEQED
ncbi:MAG: hypothetical protein SFV22_00775 [Saprospiraceae bacterium]|nr:hypothetical protein [Saprospiraceae bacterium]